MAAYAALVSLEHIINNLQLHSRPPVSLHKEQVRLLTQKVTFLQQFLEVYNPTLGYSKEADPLESRIARAAYAAEDAIESHILDQFSNNDGEKMSSNGLYEALEKVIEEMALIEKVAIKINKEIGGFQNQLQAKSKPSDSSSRSYSSSITQKKSMMVGADDMLLELKDKLTSNRPDLQTIPVVGMGGSGKTTLALNVYEDRLIEEHFDICAWVTISQEYSISEILKQILIQLNKESSEGELGEMLYKHLCGKRFMIILDDIWSVKAWDGVKWFLPDNKNGSRIVITTRITTLASTLSSSNSLEMKLLDEDASWDLLSKTVFGVKGCPLAYQDIGKKIGKGCKGLPLSIVVVGGLLAMSEQSIESWVYMEGNLNAIVNLEDDERCLKTLYMSYKQLPVYLKPCLLYMGIFREDYVISVSKLVKLWVAEGFLKPVSGKRAEDVGRAYIKDLTERNLILIHKWGTTGSIKECKVHDLLRDLCLREAHREGFYIVFPGIEIGDKVSRMVMPRNIPYFEEIDALLPVPLVRSMILNQHDVPPNNLQLVRISEPVGRSNWFLDNKLANLRFLNVISTASEFPSIIWLFWNLQTLTISRFDEITVPDHFEELTVPTDIWYMSHIRHLYYENIYLPDPLNVQDGIVLANLQTLDTVRDFTCSEQMVKRIPNIRKLKISYEDGVDQRFYLSNLDCLDKLESLTFDFTKSMSLINFPQSLKKLTIGVQRSQYCWHDILDKIGDLPLLQKLKLCYGNFKGQWETSEGQFRSLKFLSLEWCKGLQVWTSEASHFPILEELHLFGVRGLKEIPSDFADITTFRRINLIFSRDSVVESAKRILEEQEALHGEEETYLQIHVSVSKDNNPALESFGSYNFHIGLFNHQLNKEFLEDDPLDNIELRQVRCRSREDRLFSFLRK